VLEVGRGGGFGQHGSDFLLGRLVDESVYVVPLGVHKPKDRPGWHEPPITRDIS
jgi:hypothetical protein